jgi:exodeoxyribonuclease VII large subunit
VNDQLFEYIEPQKSPDVISQEPSYTVDNLFTRLGIVGQATLWKKVDAIIRVQGKVTDLKSRSYQGYSYFKLRGVKSSISIKCPSDRLPIENENVIIEGMPILKVGYNNALEVQLEGEPVGKIAPVDYIDEVIEIKKDTYVRLDKLLETNPLHTLKFFGTAMTLTDVLSPLSHHKTKIQSQVIVVSDKDRILKALESGLSGASGFVIVRGGADGTLDIWDDAKFVKKLLDFGIPFYVALGHTHQIGLVAQYADESFSTPATLGSTINDILKMQAYIGELDSTVERLGKDHEKTVAELTKVHQDKTAQLNKISQVDMLKLKHESDLKFELLAKENVSKLTKLGEKSERQFQALSKESEQKIVQLTETNKIQTHDIHKLYQDRLTQSEKELRAKSELDLLGLEKKQESLRDDYEKKLSMLRLDKDQHLKNITNENKQELEKFHNQKSESIAKLTDENNKLALKLEGIKPRKPIIEWIVIAVVLLLSAYFYF